MPVVSRMLAGIVAALAVALHWDTASAHSVAEAAGRWLIGTWSTNCSQPPSRRNVQLSYRRDASGRLVHERNFGDGREIQSARIVREDMIELRVDFGSLGGVRRQTLLKRPDCRHRAMSNSRLDGTDVSVRDGKLVATGSETPWQTRCFDPTI